MADDFWQRKRKEEEAEEREREAQAEELARKSKGKTGKAPSEGLHERFEDMIRRVPILIDQLTHLYQHFMTGVLFRPPIEERNRLDQLMTVLANMQKGTPSDRFRFNTIQASYQTHKQRWDKIVQDVESGKIQRVTGPAKAGRSRQ